MVLIIVVLVMVFVVVAYLYDVLRSGARPRDAQQQQLQQQQQLGETASMSRFVEIGPASPVDALNAAARAGRQPHRLTHTARARAQVLRHRSQP